MISFDEFLKQDEADKYNMLLECNAIIQQKENIIKGLNNIINELEKYIRARADDNNTCSVCSVMTDDLLNILKGVDKK